MDEVGYRQRTYSLKYKPGTGYQWRFNDTDEAAYPQIFPTQEAAETWWQERFGKHTLTCTLNGSSD